MRARSVLTAVTLAAVSVFVWWDLRSVSPGELSWVHSQESELDGQAGCVACHGDKEAPLASACGACHEATLASVEAGTGLHGTLELALGGAHPASVPATDCGPCHREHHGAELELVTSSSFRLAGFASRDAFDHERLGLTLDGAHAELACTACHANADVLHLGRGEQRFSGLSVDCASCHESEHNKAFLEDAALTASMSPDAVCAGCHTTEEGGFDSEVSRLNVLTELTTTPVAESPAERREAHAALGFALEAPHEAATCAECHGATSPNPTTSLGRALVARSETTPRFAGRAPEDCAACHSDPHRGANGANCLECHQPTGPWEDLSAFGHDIFSLSGVHGASSCTECHAEKGPTSTNALSGRRDRALPNPPRSCTACHEDPHSGAFLAGVAAELALTTSDDTCTTCHSTALPPSSSGGPGFHLDPEDFPLELHDASGMSLAAPHNEVACQGCHSGSEELVPADFLRTPDTRFAPPSSSLVAFEQRFKPATKKRSSDACASCHASPHEGDFEHLAGSPNDCTACHSETEFQPASFDAEQHKNTRFPLDGAHLAVGCYLCHERETDAPCPRFSDAPKDCAACHEDVHRDELTGWQGESDCAACHTTEDFHQVNREDLDHAASFDFSLVGAHAAAACESCHRPEPASTPGQRLFGRVSIAFPGDSAQCTTCHVDEHAGAFDGPDMPREVDGRASCARCHSQTTFALESTTSNFDHALWARFPLEGAHKEADCAACHNQPPSAPGRLPGVRGATCIDCHADIHLGQFEVESANGFPAVTDCSRCHSVLAEHGFKDTSFDHNRDSSFVLDETHAPLDCAACHRAWPLEGGGEVVRYKPLGQTCADCHGVVPK